MVSKSSYSRSASQTLRANSGALVRTIPLQCTFMIKLVFEKREESGVMVSPTISSL